MRTPTGRVGNAPSIEPDGQVGLQPPESLRLKGLRILVVEDEALVALQLEDMLYELGCVVIGPASRVGQALELLGAHRVDAAVLDLNVAGELVYPVAEVLEKRAVPFIFATGYGASGVADPYRGHEVLQKPFLLSQLRKTLMAGIPQQVG